MGMESVRAAFIEAAAGELRLDHAGMTYKPQGQTLSFTGWHADGTPFAITTAPFAGFLTDRARTAARDIIQAHTGQPHMSKLQQIAARAPAVVKALEDRAAKFGDRLDALEKRGNGTFDKWDSHLTEQETAVSQAEDAINQLSNGAPLDTSPAASPATPQAT